MEIIIAQVRGARTHCRRRHPIVCASTSTARPAALASSRSHNLTDSATHACPRSAPLARSSSTS
eukprot:7380835-Prymnesium_polylepis.2